MVTRRIKHWYKQVPCDVQGAGLRVFRKLYRGLLVVLVLGVGLGAELSSFLPAPTLVQPYLRALERRRVLRGLEGYHQMRSEHYDLYYWEEDANVARLILETAEGVWAPVSTEMGSAPRGRVPLILYPGRDELRRAFGWGQSESALGVYWQGTVRLLSPNVWLDGMKGEREVNEFARLNPIAHELTHYILDERTGGNYPRWFTEAVAQLVEERVTGYVWLEAASKVADDLYEYEELSRSFHTLANQALAYRQSYLFLRWLAERSGEQAIDHLIQALARGDSFPNAFSVAYGGTPERLFHEWREWALTSALFDAKPLVE